MYQEREIRAVYTDETIRVYQAYNEQIAKEAVAKGTFGSSFSMNRMTWIKPSFLWMMYRCGWGEKENQEHILAIDVKGECFDNAVRNAVPSSYHEESGLTRLEWQKLIKESEVRVQWDPEKDVYGNNLSYRSLQLGLRGQTLYEYVNDWIVGLSDITEYIKELSALKAQGRDITDLLPKERVYLLDDCHIAPYTKGK